MDYERISRIKKAKLYEQERATRVDFQHFTATVKGENSNHTVTFDENSWHCTCDYFKSRGYCSHTMALERILQSMIPGPGETQSALDGNHNNNHA